jgi:hypothetical protein
LLRERFKLKVNGTIWNLLAEHESQLLILEVRNEEKFTTRFVALNYQTGRSVWEISLTEAWLINLVDARQGTLLVHTYTNRGNPDRKNLIAVDMATGKERWQVEDVSFYGWSSESILGYSSGEELTQVSINPRTGQIEKGVWSGNIVDRMRSIERPIQYAADTEHFLTVKKYIRIIKAHTIEGVVEYLELPIRTILSYYVKEETGLANYLLVLNQEGETLLVETLGKGLKGLGMDTFFHLADCVIFVKNKSELVSYSLYD